MSSSKKTLTYKGTLGQVFICLRSLPSRLHGMQYSLSSLQKVVGKFIHKDTKIIVGTERLKCFIQMNLTAGDVFAHTFQGLAISEA